MNRRGVRILAAGVDSLYLSARAHYREDLLLRLAMQRAGAEEAGEPVVVDFGHGDGLYLLRPHSWRGYRYWLTSPRFELFIGAQEPFPPVYVMVHSAYLHTVGVEEAIADVEATLSRDLFRGSCVLTVSRADLYADVQGWTPRLSDIHRFVCRGVKRRTYLAPAEAHTARRQLTGFTFGKGDVMARIYDKSAEMRATGTTWPDLLWTDAVPDLPVWRIEFQLRRRALSSFGAGTPHGFLLARQDLWNYATRWLSMRTRSRHAEAFRWPEARVWTAVRGATMGSPASGLVRERIEKRSMVRLARGFVGYASSIAVVTGAENLDAALADTLPIAQKYLEYRGTSFDRIVERKRRTSRPGRGGSAA